VDDDYIVSFKVLGDTIKHNQSTCE
jgi:hypothetical protein